MTQQERFSFDTEFGRLFERVEHIAEGQARLEQQIASHLEYHTADRESSLKAQIYAQEAMKVAHGARWSKVRTTALGIGCALIGVIPGILTFIATHSV